MLLLGVPQAVGYERSRTAAVRAGGRRQAKAAAFSANIRGRKKRAVPVTDKPVHAPHFMQRVCEALDVLPLELAEKLQVPYADIEDMWTGSRLQIGEVLHEEVWEKLGQYIDRHMGMMLAVREELRRKMNLEMRRRLTERERILNR